MDRTHPKTIIEKYRKSTFDDRIFLFLDHPGMRSAFTAVDMAEAALKRQKQSTKNGTAFWKPEILNPIKAIMAKVSFTAKPPTNVNE